MNTPENKKMLWELLYKNKLFTGLDNSDINDVILKFEENIKLIDNKYSTEPLLEQNKLFIDSFINILKNFNQSKKNINSGPELYKREDIRNIELKNFSDKHNKIVEEFNKFKPSPPPEIDFSDNVKEETTDISNALNKLNNERKNDVSIEGLYKLLSEIKTTQLTILSYIKSTNMDISTNNIDLLQ